MSFLRLINTTGWVGAYGLYYSILLIEHVYVIINIINNNINQHAEVAQQALLVTLSIFV